MPKSRILFQYIEDFNNIQSAATASSQHNQATIYFSDQYGCLIIDISHVDLANSIGNLANFVLEE